MKRLFLIAFTCASLVAPVGAAAPRGLSESGSVALIARLAPGVDAVAEAALHRTAGAEVTRRTDALGLIALEVDRQDVWRYRESPLIRWVERDRVRPVTEAPNDPHLRNQWPFDKLRLQKAWGREPGTSNPVTVAVVDTGVDFEHPDLDGRLVSGFDFVNNDELPADDHGHGTHVSGVIAANPDNRVGIAGMSWGAKIMPLKACSAKGRCPDSTVASAIAYAAVSGADIVNLSLGGPSPACPRAFELAARLAEARGVLLVASSANDAQSGNPVANPAACAGYVAVGATDPLDRIAAFSSHGAHVDVSAPGVQVLSTVPFDSPLAYRRTPGYGYGSGTSMAAPHVAGLAALIVAAHPEWGPAEILDRILTTAKDLGPKGRDPFFGAGRIDVVKALAR